MLIATYSRKILWTSEKSGFNKLHKEGNMDFFIRWIYYSSPESTKKKVKKKNRNIKQTTSQHFCFIV